MFKQPKHSHWNIECGSADHIHWSSHSIPLGAVSLVGASISGMATVLTKKYQKKLAKLVDNKTSTIAVFDTSVSKALDNGHIDEREFQVLQTLHLKVINELSNVDRKMESETRTQLQKSFLEEINKIKKTLRTRDVS